MSATALLGNERFFVEIRTVALEFPFSEQITADDKAHSLELLVEMYRIKRLVRAIERELSA